jgi:hypothetical protein
MSAYTASTKPRHIGNELHTPGVRFVGFWPRHQRLGTRRTNQISAPAPQSIKAQMRPPATNCNRNRPEKSALGITWEGTPVLDFARTFAVASATAAMLFSLAVTFGFISQSSRPVASSQTIAQQK